LGKHEICVRIHPTRADLLRDLAARSIWWRDEHAPSDDRVIAQAVDLGTWADIRRLEATHGADELRAIMLRAEPGWISRGRSGADGSPGPERHRSRRHGGRPMPVCFEPR
jgi:hypothetical protein